MNHRKILLILLFSSLVVLFAGVYFMLPCSPSENFSCSGIFSESIGFPLVFGFLPISVILSILLFSRREIFQLWWKFALVYSIVGFFWVITTPVECNAPLHLCFDKQRVVLFWDVGFLVVSFFITVVQSLRLRAKKKLN